MKSTLLERFVIECSRAERLPFNRMPKILRLASIPLLILFGILGATLYGSGAILENARAGRASEKSPTS